VPAWSSRQTIGRQAATSGAAMNLTEMRTVVDLAKVCVAKKGMEYGIDSEVSGLYPYWKVGIGECVPATANVFIMKEQTGAKVHNMVLACLGEGDLRCKGSAQLGSSVNDIFPYENVK
jgi:hypothetical protein